MNQKNIIAGFKTTGIYPFNPRVLVPESNTDASDSPLSLCKATGLKYIPLYSPQPKFQKSLSHIAELSFTDEEMVRYERKDMTYLMRGMNSGCNFTTLSLTLNQKN